MAIYAVGVLTVAQRLVTSASSWLIALGGTAALTTIGLAAGLNSNTVGFAFETHVPDLVLTDLSMPRSDGFVLISAIQPTSRTPNLVLSVRGNDADKIRALDLRNCAAWAKRLPERCSSCTRCAGWPPCSPQ